MPSLSRWGVSVAVIGCLLLAYSDGGLSGQTAVEEKHGFNRDIRCVIQAERRRWNQQVQRVADQTGPSHRQRINAKWFLYLLEGL